MEKPLEGVRVVEVGTYVAGPALGCILGMMGAEVIKVEPPEGDTTRSLTVWSWINYNWNKKSISIDLKDDEGIKIFKQIIKSANVFIESLAPNTTRKLGINYSSLRRVNPNIIYCSIKGFASDSKSSHRVAFDALAQAEGGLIYATKSKGQNPTKIGNPCVDLGAAAFGVIEILGALLMKKGIFIEIPLLDIVVYWNSYWYPYIDIFGEEPPNISDSHPGFCPYGVYRTQDGFIFIGVISDSHWKNLERKLDLKSENDLSRMKQRVALREQVDFILEKATSRMTKAELLELLSDDTPCASINTLRDIHSDQELMQRGVMKFVKVGEKNVKIALPPLTMRQTQEKDLVDLPTRGFHTDSILEDLDYTFEDINLLRKKGVVR